MKFRKIGKIIFSIFLLSLFMFAFTACHGSLFNYRGATVDAENRIALLEGKLRQGQWHSPVCDRIIPKLLPGIIIGMS